MHAHIFLFWSLFFAYGSFMSTPLDWCFMILSACTLSTSSDHRCVPKCPTQLYLNFFSSLIGITVSIRSAAMSINGETFNLLIIKLGRVELYYLSVVIWVHQEKVGKFILLP